MNVYCNFNVWLKEHNPAFADLLDNICLGQLFAKTLINPTKELVDEMSKMLKSKDKNDRRILSGRIRSLYLAVDLHDKNFRPGKHATINNNNTIEVSAPTNGVFTIKSGKDLKTEAKVKLNNTFEAEWKYKIDEDKNMCVVDLISGTMSHEGITMTGIMQPAARMEGASEYVASTINMKLLNWEEVTSSTCAEICAKVPIAHAAVCCAGLLKYIMIKAHEVPEYNDIGKLIHAAMCCEPFAMWYILVQPFSQNQLMPGRLIEEWQFAPFVCEDFAALWDEFAAKYPTEIDHQECKAMIATIKEAGGKFSVSELQEAYTNHCTKLFSHIANFPCEQKLWLDEVCYYICSQMCEIRATNNTDAFKELCNVLKTTYPGKDHKAECKIGSEAYWSRIAGPNDVKNVQGFIDSFCCIKNCHTGDDAMAAKCRSTLTSLAGRKPSRRLQNTVLLNK